MQGYINSTILKCHGQRRCMQATGLLESCHFIGDIRPVPDVSTRVMLCLYDFTDALGTPCNANLRSKFIFTNYSPRVDAEKDLYRWQVELLLTAIERNGSKRLAYD